MFFFPIPNTMEIQTLCDFIQLTSMSYLTFKKFV